VGAGVPVPEPAGEEDDDPGYLQVRDFLLYTLSVPERTLRSATGLVSGFLRESTCLLVPQAFQDSKTYTILVRQGLNFFAEDVGGVARAADAKGPPKVENFVARKAVGNFIEMAGLATIHLSPLIVLAIVGDVVYGSHVYLRELGDDLKQQGIIDEDSTINRVDDLFEAVADASKTAAGAFDTPPLSVDGLKQTISDTRKAVAAVDPTAIIPQSEIARLWTEIHTTATSQGVNPLAISGAMTLYALNKVATVGRGALSTIRVAGNLFDEHIIDYYAEALGDIRQKGIYASLRDTSGPYIEAVWNNFSTDRTTITEEILSGRVFGKAWRVVARWFGHEKTEQPPSAAEGQSEPDSADNEP